MGLWQPDRVSLVDSGTRPRWPPGFVPQCRQTRRTAAHGPNALGEGEAADASLVLPRCGLDSPGQPSPENPCGWRLSKDGLGMRGRVSRTEVLRAPASRSASLGVPGPGTSGPRHVASGTAGPLGASTGSVFATLEPSSSCPWETSGPSPGTGPLSFLPPTNRAMWANVRPTGPRHHGGLRHWQLPGPDGARCTGSPRASGSQRERFSGAWRAGEAGGWRGGGGSGGERRSSPGE